MRQCYRERACQDLFRILSQAICTINFREALSSWCVSSGNASPGLCKTGAHSKPATRPLDLYSTNEKLHVLVMHHLFRLEHLRRLASRMSRE